MIRLWWLWYMRGARVFHVRHPNGGAGVQLSPHHWPHAKALIGHYLKIGYKIRDAGP